MRCSVSRERWARLQRTGLASAAFWLTSSLWAQITPPIICSIRPANDELVVVANVSAGYQHAALEVKGDWSEAQWLAVVAGPLGGDAAAVSFRVPDAKQIRMFRVSAGPGAPPASLYSGAPYFGAAPGAHDGWTTDAAAHPFCRLNTEQQIGHVLHRLGYGPTAESRLSILQSGVSNYVEEQLRPETIDESGNTRLQASEAALFAPYQPAVDQMLIRLGDPWRYRKGTNEPPVGWNDLGHADGDWAVGPTPIGYGDDAIATELEDMQQLDAAAGTPGQSGYLAFYARKSFYLSDPQSIGALIYRVDYDDGFVAYLNGTEVARRGLTGTPPRSNQAATSHESGVPVEIDLSGRKNLLRAGWNDLAIQLHNTTLNSSDAVLSPELISRTALPVPPEQRIKGITELQELLHVRGIQSRRQLQVVLAEFWDNHFTTDYDKLVDYLDDLENSDASDAMSDTRARAEAAHMEYLEHEFFREHALGYFGDLLLYSATSPPMLIYLDNVLNSKDQPNENYAREILELFAFGVDNRYTQQDIEQLARCFTGWTLRKAWPADRLAFPASARTPLTQESVRTEDRPWIGLGSGWKYFKGTAEPSPAADRTPTSAWTEIGFADGAWLNGATGIGYGDGDDATVLSDMRSRYASVYLRRRFTAGDLAELQNLVLKIAYDDGFVAYLNGVEVVRSETMAGTGYPPPRTALARGGHEGANRPQYYSLREYVHLLRPAPAENVLALQVHNLTLDSSDLSAGPELVDRRQLPGSIENGDPNGLWTFRFNPAEHDLAAKVLFDGTPWQMNLPAGRAGTEGVKDAIEVIDAMVQHPSTAEFICLKLVNRFVSDEITLETYHDGTAPAPLRSLMDAAIQAWNSTTPAGHIGTVLRRILDPGQRRAPFWAENSYRTKIKTPIEYINSSVRALGGQASGTPLPAYNADLGMTFFTRDEPDGWSEYGVDWVDTGTMLARMKFAQTLAQNRTAQMSWDVRGFLSANRLATAEEIVAHFNQLLFQGTLWPEQRDLLRQFAETDDLGNPKPLDPRAADYFTRVQQLVGLILALPHWHYQ